MRGRSKNLPATSHFPCPSVSTRADWRTHRPDVAKLRNAQSESGRAVSVASCVFLAACQGLRRFGPVIRPRTQEEDPSIEVPPIFRRM